MEHIDDMSDIQTKYLDLAVQLGVFSPQLFSEESDAVHADSGECMQYSLHSADNFMVRGCVSGLPGCCGVGVLHDTLCDEDPKWLKYIFELREDIARYHHWGMILQTHVMDHKPTRRVMRNLDWRVLKSGFTNPNSKNRLTLWGKVLV